MTAFSGSIQPPVTASITFTQFNMTDGGTNNNAVQTFTILYRGQSGGNFVYQTNSPPVGATDIVVVGKF